MRKIEEDKMKDKDYYNVTTTTTTKTMYVFLLYYRNSKISFVYV